MPASAQLFVGTSGFSYSSWRGRFYPKGIRSTDMLAYYAQRLATVEVNTTFYRTQPDDVVAGWAAAVPPAFRFAVKAHRRITHNRRMPNLEEAVRALVGETEGFGERLGPVLFQFPPTAPFDESRLPRIGGTSNGPVHVAGRDQLRDGGNPRADVPRDRSPQRRFVSAALPPLPASYQTAAALPDRRPRRGVRRGPEGLRGWQEPVRHHRRGRPRQVAAQDHPHDRHRGVRGARRGSARPLRQERLLPRARGRRRQTLLPPEACAGGHEQGGGGEDRPA